MDNDGYECGNSIYECYVFQCYKCGEYKFINKHQNILKLFELSCKCNSTEVGKYMLIGEGSFESKKIVPKNQIIKETSDSYIRDEVYSKTYKNYTYYK